jgi:hypothetical protein
MRLSSLSSTDADRGDCDPYLFFSPQNSLDIRPQQIELGQQLVASIGVLMID